MPRMTSCVSLFCLLAISSVASANECSEPDPEPLSSDGLCLNCVTADQPATEKVLSNDESSILISLDPDILTKPEIHQLLQTIYLTDGLDHEATNAPNAIVVNASRFIAEMLIETTHTATKPGSETFVAENNSRAQFSF